MQIGRYRLVSRIGAGVDGTSFRVESDDGEWELRRLDAAKADDDRWQDLVTRISRASLVRHPCAVGFHETHLDHDPPYFVLPHCPPGSSAAHAKWKPRSATEVAKIGVALASVIADGHRVGVAYGRPLRTHAWMEASGRWRLDFSGAACTSSQKRAIDGPAAYADDVASLAEFLEWLWKGDATDQAAALRAATMESEPEEDVFRQLLEEMRREDAIARPSAEEVERRLRKLSTADRELATTVEQMRPTMAELARTIDGGAAAQNAAQNAVPMPGRMLGRFRLDEKLGEGGMGEVFRATDVTNDTVVAIKVMNAVKSASNSARQRFLKECRLLEQIRSPYVTQLVESSHDGEIHYLALEYVSGANLGELMAKRGPLPEDEALPLAVDTLRGLASAHSLNIVHRDVKPENILLVEPDEPNGRRTAKLTDFGLARQVVQTSSMVLTQAGTMLGTPVYMAPEQFSGETNVDARSDVYSFGVTLYHMLAGKPPFEAMNLQELMVAHMNAAPPSLLKGSVQVSDATARIIERSLAKKPEDRYADADSMLRALEAVLRGEPTTERSHPKLPDADPSRVMKWEFRWELESSPRQLWPHVSNTERINRALKLKAVDYSTRPDVRKGVRRFGSTKVAGMRIDWEEHPFEWIEGRRMGVLREFRNGPFKWFVSVVEFLPRADGGTSLVQSVQVEPTGLFGRIAGWWEIGVKSKRSLGNVYKRIDKTLRREKGFARFADPIEAANRLSLARRKRLEDGIERIVAAGVPSEAAFALGGFLAEAPDQEVSRIRPYVVARQRGVDEGNFLDACLRGVQAGLLQLQWDILCPLCRIPTAVKDTLRMLREHEHCSACNVDFSADLNAAVEMIFCVHPDVRKVETGTYCIGGPAHSPHVAAQCRIAEGESMQLDLNLEAGVYRIRGSQIPWSFDFRVAPDGSGRRWEVPLSEAPKRDDAPILLPGMQELTFRNDLPIDALMRIERTLPRDDVVTAAAAAAMPLFRELFPGEVLAPGQLAQASTISLLLTQLAGGRDLYERLGEVEAFRLVQQSFRSAEAVVRAEGGAVVKTVSEGVTAAFTETTAAVRAALSLQKSLNEAAGGVDAKLRCSVHRGLAMIATHNDRLDYFGSVVKTATRLLQTAGPGEILLSGEVVADPEVDELLTARAAAGDLVEVEGVDQPALRLAEVR